MKLNKKTVKRGTFFFLTLLILSSLLDGILTSRNFKKVRGSIKVYNSDDNLIYESINGLEGYQTPVNLEVLPKYVSYAVISAEDARFFKHFGFDPLAMSRALITNLGEGRIVSGGSTITQQVVKDNLAFPINSKYIRKIRELNSSLYLELFFSKDQILEKYLSNVYLGGNFYGFAAGSMSYFSKPPHQLTLGEAATLAGSIKSPAVLNPQKPVKAVERRNEVLSLMKDRGYISDEEYEEVTKYPLGINLYERKNNHLHFVDYALQESKTILDVQSLEEIQGYEIYTTLSSGISELALEEARSQVNRLEDKHKLTNASIVVLDAEESAILAMIGSIDYFNEEIDGAVNLATSLRQPGSALKPFTYGQAFYEGVISPEETILDEKTTFVDKKGESFVPHNYNGVFNGEVPVRVALASSLNLPAVKVLEMVGVEDMIEAANKAGIKTLSDPERYDLSVTLGGGEVTLLQLANAYNSLARGGYYLKNYSVREIRDYEGNKVYEYRPELKTPIWGHKTEEVSKILFSILSDSTAKVLGFGRNNVLNLPFSSASKTGTTTDWHDNWTFGYTKDFTVGVWVGNSDNSPMYSIDGVTGAGPIWREVMIGVNDLKNPNPSEGSLSLNLEPPDPSYIKGIKEVPLTEEIPSGLIKSDGKQLKILNPSQNSKYFLNINESEFQKIGFEVSFNNEVNYVEYLLDGRKVSTALKKDDFEFLWDPEKGVFEVSALFYNSSKELIGQDQATFYVF